MYSNGNSRIAKNTIFLYIRMILVMLVSLYTSRIVLEVLGVKEYGIWSLVFTVVTSVSFITNPLAASTQRFLNVAIGENNLNKAKDVFKTSVYLYLYFAMIILFLLETAGLWFLNNKIDIPQEYYFQANIVYQFAIFSFIIAIFRLTFDATIIANEKFNFFAIIGIIETILKLLIVYLLLIFPTIPHLILYGFLSFVTSLIVAISYVLYCRKKFKYLINYGKPKDKGLTIQMLSFSGWNTFGQFSSMTSNQGLSVIINMFFGVAANAAIGIANQIANAISQLVSNFQTAFQPQIVKRYSQGDYNGLIQLIGLSSKISFLLIFIISCPILFNIDFILSIWLTDVPPLASDFSVLIIICTWIEAISAPLWMTINAVGKIRNYQLIISFMLLSAIIISYILLSFGLSADTVFKVKIGILIACLLVRCIFVKIQTGISYNFLFKTFALYSIIIGITGISILWAIRLLFNFNNWQYLIIGSLIFLVTFSPSAFYMTFTKNQRDKIFKTIKLRLNIK